MSGIDSGGGGKERERGKKGMGKRKKGKKIVIFLNVKNGFINKKLRIYGYFG